MKVQFTVEMGELRRKINFVRNGLGSMKTELSTMLMRFDVLGGKVRIFAANKELFCRTEMKMQPAEGSDDGVYAVLGDRLEKLISQVEAEQVEFTADGENLEVRAGFLTVNFETYDGAALRTIEQGTKKHLELEGLAVERGAMEEALSCARSCTTISSIRPDVTHVELRKGRMLSSDGRKIMIYSHDGFPEEMRLKIPSTSLNACIGAVKNIESEHVQVIESETHYFLKGNKNEYTLGVRKVERDFPAVEGQIANTENPTDEIVVDKHVLEAMLRGVSLGLPSDEVKVIMEVGGTGQEAYLELSSRNALNKRSHERASCGRKGKGQIAWPLSFKHLLDTLGVFKGDSVVDVMVMEDRNLLMVRDSTDAREVLTVIPFRTDKAIEEEKKTARKETEAKKKAKEAESKEGEEMATAAVAEPVGEDIDLEDV